MVGQGQVLVETHQAAQGKGARDAVFTGGFAALVVGRAFKADRVARLVAKHHSRLAGLGTGHQVEFDLVGAHGVDLVHGLFQVAHIEQVARAGRHGQAQVNAFVWVAFDAQALNAAFDHQQLQLAAGQVLRRQVGAGGDKAALNVVAGHGAHQFFNVGGAHAAAQQATDQCALVVGVQQIGAHDVNADNVVAVAFGLAGVYPGHDRFQVHARGRL